LKATKPDHLQGFAVLLSGKLWWHTVVPHDGRGSACLVRLWPLEPLQRYPYRHRSNRLSRRPAVKGAVLMVSRGGTYSANVNKYQRSFPELCSMFRSLLLSVLVSSSHCVWIFHRLLYYTLNTFAGVVHHGEEIPRWLWRGAYRLDLGVSSPRSQLTLPEGCILNYGIVLRQPFLCSTVMTKV
jgi:hypothetical protein